jgi:hypothetical protein
VAVNEHARRLKQDYRAAFLRYLSRRDEVTLHTGYVLGRQAVGSGVSLLETVQVHHEVLLDVLADARGADELGRIASAASEFVLELLAPFAMRQPPADESGRARPS